MEGGDMMTSMNKTIYINDIALSDFNIYCFSDTYLNGPSIDYTSYDIPSRIGSMVQYNKRFNNVERVFSCICSKETYVESLNSLKNIIYKNVGYVKIASDYEPNMYQFGYMVDDIEVNPHINEETITFELRFSCNPKKFYVEKRYEQVSIHNSSFVTKYNDKTIEILENMYSTYIQNMQCACVYNIDVIGPQFINRGFRVNDIEYLNETIGDVYAMIFVLFDENDNTTIIESKRVEIDDEIFPNTRGRARLYIFSNWFLTLPKARVGVSYNNGTTWTPSSQTFNFSDSSFQFNDETFNDIYFQFTIRFNKNGSVSSNEKNDTIIVDGDACFVLDVAEIQTLKNDFDTIEGYLKKIDEAIYEANVRVDIQSREVYVESENGARFSLNKYVQMYGDFFNPKTLTVSFRIKTNVDAFFNMPNKPIEFTIERWVL